MQHRIASLENIHSSNSMQIIFKNAHTHMHTTTTNEKESVNLKDGKEGLRGLKTTKTETAQERMHCSVRS